MKPMVRQVFKLALFGIVVIATLGAGAPEIKVVPVRVPTKSVETWFPARTPLRGLDFADFERLLEAVRSRSVSEPTPGRILSAHHQARWMDGTLTGETELTIELASTGPSLIPLSPWTPAIVGSPPSVVSLNDGQTALRLPPDRSGFATVQLKWRQAARPKTSGNAFALALPSQGLTRLTLDLPDSLAPDNPLTLAPTVSPSSESGRKIWIFEGPWANSDLRLLPTTQPSPFFVGGSTVFSLGRVTASWKAEWVIDRREPSPRRLVIELDPRLDLTSVIGPQVSSSLIETQNNRTRLIVRFDPSTRGSTSLTLQGVTVVPSIGSWTIPFARPLDSVWIGGTTTTKLDPSRVLTDCRELGGRRAAAREEAGTTPVVVFVSHAAGSVGELNFTPPLADIWAEVKGRVQVGNGKPRLSATIAWNIARGRPLSLQVQLPPGWSPERVERTDGTLVSDWTSTTQEKAGTTLAITPPTDVSGLGHLEMVIKASSDRELSLDRWTPPRLRPINLRIAEESWVLELSKGLKVRPTLARGLSWINPSRVSDPKPDDALAWRWLENDGELEMSLGRTLPQPSWSATINARVGKDVTHLDAQVVADFGDSEVSSIGFVSNRPADPSVEWRLTDQPDNSVVTEINPTGWRLILAKPCKGRIKLAAKWRPQPSSQPIALIFPGDGRSIHGRVAIHWSSDVFGSISSKGMVKLDPKFEHREGFDQLSLNSTVLGYDDPTDQVTLAVEPLRALTPDGVITESILTTLVDPAGLKLRHRLQMGVRGGAVQLKFPDGVSIDTALVDGRPVVPIVDEAGIRISLGTAEKPRSQLVVLELSSRLQNVSDPITAPWPSIDIPVLTRRWDLVVPEPWNLALAHSGWSDDSIASPTPTDRLKAFVARFTAQPRTSDFLARIKAANGPDRPIAELFAEWQSPTYPFVIDRLGLASSGWFPNGRLKGSSNTPILERIRESGLELRPIGGAIVVTTSSEPLSIGWEVATHAALATGSDMLNRLQSLDRWIATPTLFNAAPEGATGDPRPGPGWKLVRLIPDTAVQSAEVSVRLIDPLPSRNLSVVVAVIVLLFGYLVHKMARRRRVQILSMIVLAMIFVYALDLDPGLRQGLLAGSCGVALLWAGQACRRKVATRSLSGSSPSRVRIAAAFLIVIAALPMVLGAELVGPVAPILVLLPYDQIPKPGDRPTRAIMRLSDFERLNERASAPVKSLIPPIVATKVEHHAGNRLGESFVLETRWDLDVQAAGSWSFPMSGSSDLTVTIDGRPASLRIEPGSTLATILFPKPGVFRVVLQRRVETKPHGPTGHSAVIRVLPSAVATWDIDPDITMSGLQASNLLDSGQGALAIGPTDRLDLAWGAVVPPAPRDLQALLLWDAEPSGDRLRVRLRASDGEPLNEIRLGLDPGVIRRSVRHSGTLVNEAILPTAEGTEWIGVFEISSTDSARDKPIELEFWRPLTTQTGPRRGPGLELRGGGRLSGLIALRRPGNWSGRLNSPGPFGIVPDFEFVRAWGELPSEPLTLAGVVRFNARADVSARLEPTPDRYLARSDLRVSPHPGRLDWQLETKLTTLSGPAFTTELSIDPALQVVQVEASGLTYWSRPQGDRLKLRFDSSPGLERVVRVLGWIPTENSLMTIRWPRYDSASEETGRLQMVAEFAVTVEATGLRREAKDIYRLTQFDQPIGLRYEFPPTRAEVNAHSFLLIEPHTYEWINVLDYTFLDGPCESIPLQLPAAWVGELSAEIDGVPTEWNSLREGLATHKVLKPGKPLWSRARVTVRGRTPRVAGQSFRVPELIPLGTGQLRAMVGVVNASGERLVTPEARGLLPIEPAKFTGGTLSTFGVVDLAWVVQPEASWSLDLQTEPIGLAPIEPEIDLVESTLVIDQHLRLRQKTTLWLKPASTGWLPLNLPPGLNATLAMVDGDPTPLWTDAQGIRRVHIPNNRATKVSLICDSADGGHAMPLPVVMPHVGDTYRVYHPKEVTISPRVDFGPDSSVVAEEIRRLSRTIVSLTAGERGNLELRHALESLVTRLRIAFDRLGDSSQPQNKQVDQARIALQKAGWNDLANLLNASPPDSLARVATLGRLRSDLMEGMAYFGQRSSAVLKAETFSPQLVSRTIPRDGENRWANWWLLPAIVIVPLLTRLGSNVKAPGAIAVSVGLVIALPVLIALDQSSWLAAGGWFLWIFGRWARN